MLLYLCKLLLLGLGWISAVAAGGAFLAVLGVYLLGRTRGVTWEERRFGLKALFVWIGGMFVCVFFFFAANWLQLGHDQAMIDEARALMGECGRLGDAQPLPSPGKVLIWDVQRNERSKANEGLRKEFQAGWNDETLIFLVESERQLPSGPSVGSFVIDVHVVRWPQKEALGKYIVRKGYAPDPLQQMKKGEPILSGGEATIVNWIHGLPARARGDGPELKQPAEKKEKDGK
jgi:hypothetical protein